MLKFQNWWFVCKKRKKCCFVFNDGSETIAYKVNDDGYRSWETLWKYKGGGEVTDLLIINDLLLQGTKIGIEILNIQTGKLKYSLEFHNNDIQYTRLLAGKDKYNRIWIIANCDLSDVDYNARTTVFAFN